MNSWLMCNGMFTERYSQGDDSAKEPVVNIEEKISAFEKMFFGR